MIYDPSVLLPPLHVCHVSILSLMNKVSQDGSWSQVSPAGLNSFGLDHPLAMLSSSDHVITVFNGNAMKRGFASYSRDQSLVSIN